MFACFVCFIMCWFKKNLVCVIFQQYVESIYLFEPPWYAKTQLSSDAHGLMKKLSPFYECLFILGGYVSSKNFGS